MSRPDCDCDQYVGLGEHFCGKPNEGEDDPRIAALEAELLEYRKMAARYRKSDEQQAEIRALMAVAEAADVLIRTGERKYEKDLAVALTDLAARGVPVR